MAMVKRGSPAMKLRTTTALLALMLASSAPLAQQGAPSDTARIEKFKTTVVESVDARRKLAQVINDTVFSFGELAYQEFETSKYLTEVLETNGFKVERGAAGMPTEGDGHDDGRPADASGADREREDLFHRRP